LSGVSYLVQPRLHDRRGRIGDQNVLRSRACAVTVSNTRKVIHRREREEKKNQLVIILRRVHSLCGNNTKQRGERGWNGALKLDTYVNKHDLLFQWNFVA
jgi:hypothetical protein